MTATSITITRGINNPTLNPTARPTLSASSTVVVGTVIIVVGTVIIVVGTVIINDNRCLKLINAHYFLHKNLQ